MPPAYVARELTIMSAMSDLRSPVDEGWTAVRGDGAGGSAPRRDSPDLGARLVGDHVERAVAALAHVADTAVAVGEEVLLAHDAVARDHQAHEPLLAQRAHEE